LGVKLSAIHARPGVAAEPLIAKKRVNKEI
jgi:hypothetical protein